MSKVVIEKCAVCKKERYFDTASAGIYPTRDELKQFNPDKCIYPAIIICDDCWEIEVMARRKQNDRIMFC